MNSVCEVVTQTYQKLASAIKTKVLNASDVDAAEKAEELLKEHGQWLLKFFKSVALTWDFDAEKINGYLEELDENMMSDYSRTFDFDVRLGENYFIARSRIVQSYLATQRFNPCLKNALHVLEGDYFRYENQRGGYPCSYDNIVERHKKLKKDNDPLEVCDFIVAEYNKKVTKSKKTSAKKIKS